MEAPFKTHWMHSTWVATPQGMVAWPSSQSVYRLDPKSRKWEKLPVNGKLPGTRPDWHGMAYDAKRDRLLFFYAENKGDVTALDPKTGEVKSLQPAGMAAGTGPSREAVYIPDLDGVLLALRPAIDGADGKKRWLLYDCAKNAWAGLAFEGTDPVGNGQFNCSLGLAYHAKRKLVMTIDYLQNVTFLRLDLKTADVKPLEGTVPPPAGKK
jgi:streptogramin lyase